MGGYGSGVVMLLCLLVAVKARDIHLPLGEGRILAEAKNQTEASNSTESSQNGDRTARIDPLDSFHKYRGGYNITNKHYWGSVAFTGIYGYAIGVLWLLGGVIYGGFLLLESKDAKKKKTTRACFLLPTAMALFLSLMAIIPSGIAFAGTSRFHSTANGMKRVISDTARDATESIYNVTFAVGDIQANSERYGVTVLKTSVQLNSTVRRIEEEAYRIRNKADDAARIIGKALAALHTASVVLISMGLFLILSLLCLRFLKLRRPFQMFLVICWLLGSFLWLFFGLYFFLDRFAADTCVALEDYRQEPGNSSLSSILPCTNQQSAQTALRDTRAGIYTLINQVNANLSSSKALLSAVNMGLICNPFSKPPNYDYNPDICPKNTTMIGDIPLVLKKYACMDECNAGEFIPPNDYAAISAISTSIQQLIDSLPGVERLVDCRIIEDAFSEILFRYCRPLKRNAKMSWAAMAALATMVAFLVVAWATMDRHDMKWNASEGSVRPQSAGKLEEDNVEFGVRSISTKRVSEFA